MKLMKLAFICSLTLLPVGRERRDKAEQDNYCRPMIKKPTPFKGLNIRIPIIIPIKGRGFLNEGSGLPLRV